MTRKSNQAICATLAILTLTGMQWGCSDAKPDAQNQPSLTQTKKTRPAPALLPPLPAKALVKLAELKPAPPGPTNKAYAGAKLSAQTIKALQQAKPLLSDQAKPDQAKPADAAAAQALLRLGGLLEKQGYWQASLECFTQLGQWIRLHSDAAQADGTLRKLLLSPEILIARRGRLLAALRRNDQAIDTLQRAYRRNRSDSATAQLLLRAMVSAGRFSQAEELLLELAGQVDHGTIVPVLARRLCVRSGDQAMPGRIARAFRAKNAVSSELAHSLALAALEMKATSQAEDILQDLLREMPRDARAGAMLAGISVKAGEYNRALQRLAGLVVQNPQATDAARAGVGVVVLARRKLPADLLETFVQTAENTATPNKYALHYISANLAEGLDKQDVAAQQYAQAIAAKKDFYPAYEAQLSLRLRAKNQAGVNEVLQAVKALPGQGYYYYYLLGKAALGQGKPGEAIKALQRAYSKNSAYLPTTLALARAYERASAGQIYSKQGRENIAHSKAMYRKAIELRPERVATYRLAFAQRVRLGDLAGARSIAQQLVRQLPKSPEGILLSAEVYVLEKKYDKARFLLGQLARQFPGRADIPLLAIRAELGQFPGVLPKAVYYQSLARLRALLKKHPSNVRIRRLLAGLYTRPVPGDLDKAAAIWLGLCEQFPSNQAYCRAYALVLMRAKRFAQSQAVLEGLLKREPADGNLRRMLADVLVQQDKTPQAIALARGWWADAQKQAKPGQTSQFEWLGLLLDLYEKAKLYDQAIALLDSLVGGKSGLSTETILGRKVGLLVAADRYGQAVSLALSEDSEFPAQKLAHDLMEKKLYAKTASMLDKRIATVQSKLSKIKPAAVPAQPATKPATPATQPVKPSPDRAKYESELSTLRRIRMMARVQAAPADLAPAARWLDEQLEKHPGAKEPRELLLAVLIQADKGERALKMLDEWIAELSQAKPRPLGAAKTLSWAKQASCSLLVSLGRYADAQARCKKYIANEPNNAELYNIQASALAELGKGSQALKSLRRANQLKPDNPSYCNNLAYSLAEVGMDLPLAEKLIQQCFSILARPFPGIPSAYMDTKAWVLYKRGKFSQAGAVFLSILPDETPSQSPSPGAVKLGEHSVLWDHAGDVFYRLGWKTRANRYWNQALVAAKAEKLITRDVRDVLKNTPAKITALKAGQAVKVAPLGKKMK